jgi:hypothetical protein
MRRCFGDYTRTRGDLKRKEQIDSLALRGYFAPRRIFISKIP